MPIGTGKVGLFGGGFGIEAGSETFNAPGTFTVPEALKVVTLSGNGSTGNAGNPGNPGGDGIGGAGGPGGVIPTYYTPSTFGSQTFNPINGPIPGQHRVGNQAGAGGPASGPPAAPYCPFINPPGGPGNPGNPGGVTSVFGYCWTGGAAGNGGTGGVDGSYGTAGTAGAVIEQTNTTPNSGVPGNMSIVCPGASGGTGALAGGTGGGRGVFSVWCFPTCPCQTIFNNNAYAAGGGGGGGAGICNAGTSAPTVTANGGYNSKGITFMSANEGINPTGNFCRTNLGGNPGGGYAGGGAMACVDQNCFGSRPGSGGPVTGAQGAQVLRAGGGGGGGGAGMDKVFGCFNPTPSVKTASAAAGSGGGGGGSGSAGNPGSGAGNPGSVGVPATYNSIPVSTGCYPVQVGTGGQVIISWNSQ